MSILTPELREAVEMIVEDPEVAKRIINICDKHGCSHQQTIEFAQAYELGHISIGWNKFHQKGNSNVR